MVLAAPPSRKLRVGGRSRRKGGFRRWERPVSAILHKGLVAPSYDFALGIGDQLVSYTVTKPRKSPTRYYAHSNSLYSLAAITNTAGQVVERYAYNAYGVQTIRNSSNATLAKSAVGNDRGFTGYQLDSESALMYARARMYSANLGRFIGRDNWQYIEGYSLYSAYYVPNAVDPNGTWSSSDSGWNDCILGDSGWIDSPTYALSRPRWIRDDFDMGFTLGGFRIGYVVFVIDLRIKFSWHCTVKCRCNAADRYIWDHDENHVGGVQVSNIKIKIPAVVPYPMPGPASLRVLRTLGMSKRSAVKTSG